jgi:hypothetical protein
VVSTNDLTINFANNAVNSAAANGAGIEAGPIGSSYLTFLYNSTSNVWTSSGGLSAVGTVTAASTVGGVITGSSASVTGAVSGASASVSAASVVGGVITGTSTSVSGGVTAASVAGGVITGTSTSVTGTQTAASTVGGVITGSSTSVTGNITGSYIIANGSAITGTVANANVAAYLNLSNVDSSSSSQFYIPFTAAGGAGIPGPSVLEVDQVGSGISYFPSTGTLYTGIYSAAGNVIAAAINAATIGNTSASLVGGTVSVTGAATAASTVGGVITGSSASVTGNVTGGNLITAGLASITGNVNIGNATGVTWANASGARAWTYYNNSATSLDTVFL